MNAFRLVQKLADPFDFQAALAGLTLAPEDLPGLTRERRLAGAGS